MTSVIPLLDMNLRLSDPPLFAHRLGHALESTGFVRLVGTPVQPDLIERARSVTRKLFTHPDEVLHQWEFPEIGRAVGFTSSQVERARDIPAELGDLKRFWHVRGPDQPRQNVFPDSLVPTFGPTMVELFKALEALGLDLLEALDLYLGHDGTPLRDMAVGGASLLRPLDYPPVEGRGLAGAVRSSAHEDINLITLLVPATAPGLQILDHDGHWVDVRESPDEIVVDNGDMLQLYTGGSLDENWKVNGGRMRATTHRVVNPREGEPNVGRNSFPLFVHPRDEVVLSPTTGVTAQHYLITRLVEIGLVDRAIRDAYFAQHPLIG